MRLRRLKVDDFGCIESADVSFGPGLNVLYGPNDLGKSTLLHALRAALLLPIHSAEAGGFRPWGRDRDPQAELLFEIDARAWKVTKTWAPGAGRHATLQWSNDGKTFTTEDEGRGVDGKLRELLGWGVKGPGGRAAPRGLPRSFLSTVLLGEQAQPHTIFATSLAEDSDESGKARLSDALQAMALDPLYKAILDKTQRKVFEAFTDSGRRKAGRGSPFKQAADKIGAKREAYERLKEEAGKSEAVTEQLAEVNERRDKVMDARAEATERLERCKVDRERTRVRERALERVNHARGEVARIEHAKAEVARLLREQRDLEVELPGLEVAVEAAEAKRRACEQAVDAARRAKVAVETGGNAQAQLDVNLLEQARDGAIARTERAEGQLQRVQMWRTRLDEVAQSQRAVDTLAAKLTVHSQALAASRERLATLEASGSNLDQAVAWRRWDEARAQREASEQAAAVRAEESHRAVSLRSWAATTRREVDEEGIPTSDAIVEASRCAQDLAVAQAALGGGLAVTFELEGKPLGRPLGRVSVDGGKARTFDPTQGGLEAERELRIELLGVGTIQIHGGAKDARDRFAQARQRHETLVMPLLVRVGAKDLDGLTQTRARADERLREAADLERDADVLERQAEAKRALAEALADRLAREQALEVKVGQPSPQVLQVARAHDLEGLQRLLDEGRASLESLRREERRQHESESGVLGNLQAARERLHLAQREADTAAPNPDLGPPERAHQEAERALAEARAERTRAEAAIADRGTALRDAARQAQAAVVEAEHRLEQATREAAALRQRHGQASEVLATRRGMLTVREDQLRSADAQGATQALDDANAALAGLPEPSELVDEAVLEAAQANFDRVEAELEIVETEFRNVEGKMQLIGGQVVQERADLAHDALQTAVREEDELRLEYDAWQVLLDTLREAESEEGQHLGRLLSRAVAERFAVLTRGRYGALDLGPQLDTRGIHTTFGSDLYSVESLSEGLKEQLATLLRIAVAEHVKGTLVLDDHLVQTDLARVAWFRELLRQAAAEVQIVVMTCRVEDYVGLDERPTPGDPTRELAIGRAMLRTHDLERIIRRR